MTAMSDLAMSEVRTTCPYCGVGCGVLARVTVDGTVAVMMTNANRNVAANVTLGLTGAGAPRACVGARYAYTPVNTDQDGDLSYEPIFAAADGMSVPVAVPPLSTVVVVFPKRQ